MDTIAGRDETVLPGLRGLFEQRGFTRVRTGKFEEYALYVENKNFLDTDSIITFMDLDGKLMALKPDATLSIIKNIPAEIPAAAQKLYYIDDVYRLSRENREYKVRGQIGVELIGAEDALANLEIIDLALESLRTTGERFVLDISHLGFVSGLLSELCLSGRDESALLENIHAKNTWDIARLLRDAGVPETMAKRVFALAAFHGSFAQSLEQARELICNDEMQTAWEELAAVGGVLQNSGAGGCVNLDFSVVNDLDYYNGLIFRGYIEGVASLVLTGGRYDNLLRRMAKKGCAIGFAVSLDELNAYLSRGRSQTADLLITYSPDCDFAALLALSRQSCADGVQVRLEREDSDLAALGLRCKRHCRFVNGRLEEVPSC